MNIERGTSDSIFNCLISLPMTERRVSAWTKSIPSSALIGSAMSHPNRYGTWGDSLLATSAPNGLDTPVTSTRLGVIDFFNLVEWSGSPDYPGRPQDNPLRLRTT